MNLTTATPVQIDTELAEAHIAARQAAARRRAAAERARHIVGERKVYQGRRRVWETTDDEAFANVRAALDAGNVMPYEHRQATDTLTDADTYAAEADKHHARIDTLDAEYDRRGGWSRFFTVQGGHVHSGLRCAGGTIRPTTLIGWNPDLSGQTEAEAVAKLGPNLCTHCYPTAPVAWTLGEPKPKNPNECPNREMTREQRQSIDMRRVSKYAKCPECGTIASVTSLGALRKHNKPKP